MNSKVKGIANTNQLYRHRIVQLDMDTNRGNYNTDGEVSGKYDIQDLRKKPKELEIEEGLTGKISVGR